jgi:hypothetical protein
MNQKRIAMWSGPRNISTALMRSFENRKDSVVLDEPFYAYYLKKNKAEHPGRDLVLESQSTRWDEVVKLCLSKIPEKKSIWYQKHMAQHFFNDENISWITNLENCLLIRNPKEVIFSYKNKFSIKKIHQLGYPQQLELYNYILKNTGKPPIVIDAKDLLNKPKEMLEKLCFLFKIPFYSSMLSWPKGTRTSDGVWGKYWYKNVEKSTGFNEYKSLNIQLDRRHLAFYQECLPIYEKLFNLRMKL